MVISVIIPTSKPKYLHYTLKSVLNQQDIDDYEVIVVENPKPENKEWISKIKFPNLRYVTCEAGSNRARNYGIGLAQSNLIAITDDDVIPYKYWLSNIVNLHKLYKNVGIIGGRLLLHFRDKKGKYVNKPAWIEDVFRTLLSEIDWKQKTHSELSDIKQDESLYLVSANMSFTKQRWLEAGKFQEDIGMVNRDQYMSNDEIEFVRRCGECGSPNVLYSHQMLCYHQIPPERQTIEFFENRGYGQGYSDAKMVMRKHVGLNIDTMFELLMVGESKRFYLYNNDEIINELFSDKQVQQQFIHYYSRVRAAYINGAINAITGENVWKGRFMK